MFSIRSVARVLPRGLARSSARPLRSFASAPKPSPFARPLRLLPARPYAAAFATVAPRSQAQEGSVDNELSAKLQSELQNEQEANAAEDDELPPNLKEYLDSSPFDLHDAEGSQEVVLTRTFGNEKIRVAFSIADLQMLDQDPDEYRDDNALYDEEDLDGAADGAADADPGKPAGKPLNQGGRPGAAPTAPEDRVSAADRAAASGASPADADATAPTGPAGGESFPAHLSITIEKAGAPGALHLEAVARDGSIAIESADFFGRAAHAAAQTPEAEWARRAQYSGPPFGNLDEELQVLLERYVEERGVDTALALWVPDYIDHKEQREYVRWLANVKDFVDA